MNRDLLPLLIALAAGCGLTSRWHPQKEAVWLYQLSQPVTAPQPGVEVYVLDLFDTPPETVALLQRSGARVVAYFSAGSWEDWRPDAALYPESVLGAAYEGWDRERWVDIRALDILAPILSARLDLAVQKGFDGVDPDNVDGYLNPTGFALAPAHQLQFNRWLAQEAHRRGLAVSLKNDPEQAAALEPYFDFAVSESCFAEGWCDLWQPFTKAGKPVLAIEYTDAFTETEFLQQVCSAVPAGLHAVLHRRKLEGWGVWCGAGIAVPGVAKDLVSQPNHQSADDRPLAS
ncbi:MULTISPECIES: endo alpha-1,4 polygalactosaminidase [unclassified Synechococcus]|jgi:endo-alpha-1,4-polygalactosaminidase (GH114 family)|uniref:endo alpha-1,4 polygalactosaminidase n=1 Tax=unclassified Synechococcus TaxID=2626047 RepID=UPI0028CD754E|nr:endo alpha-1,4 polygalactosaminidase [Cyanobacteriota bacterium PSP.bin.10]